MRTSATLLVVASATLAAQAFVMPSAPQMARKSVVTMAGGDDGWRDIVGSEKNLRAYLGKEGFRYNLAKTDDEIASEGDFNLWEKIWGGTSNNAARAAARAAFRQVTTIDQYDPKKAKESKEWLAKYGYKRYYLPYLDKSAEGEVAPAAPTPAPKAEAPAPKPAFSFPKPSAPKAAAPKAAAPAAPSRPKIIASAPKAAAPAPPKAAAPAPVAPKASAPAAPKVNPNLFNSAPASKPAGNLNLLKKK